MSFRFLYVALLAAAVAAAPAYSQKSNTPIPGIDVVVKKKPAGNAIVIATSDARGKFRSTVKLQPGTYEISLQCRDSAGCGPMRFSLNFTKIEVEFAKARKVTGNLLLPAVQKVLIDTKRNPQFGRLKLTGQVEADPGGTPALADANSILQEVSTTRFKTTAVNGPINGMGGTGGGRFTFKPSENGYENNSGSDSSGQDAPKDSGGGAGGGSSAGRNDI